MFAPLQDLKVSIILMGDYPQSIRVVINVFHLACIRVSVYPSHVHRVSPLVTSAHAGMQSCAP